MGAPVGNQNAARAKLWTAAIMRALEARSSRLEQKNALDALAEKLLQQCDEGDMTALKELGDRIEGKAAQPIGGADDLPAIDMNLKVLFGKD
jgi:hypothetical protein